MSRAKVLSFINYKGGVAKTTTTYHVGCSLAQHFNKKVLLIDIPDESHLLMRSDREMGRIQKEDGDDRDDVSAVSGEKTD